MRCHLTLFRFALPTIDRTGDSCLSFAYHMFGHHINSLTVLHNNIAVWQAVGQKNDVKTWLTAVVSMTLVANDVIVFEARVGDAFSGDIGVDKIKQTPGRC